MKLLRTLSRTESVLGHSLSAVYGFRLHGAVARPFTGLLRQLDPGFLEFGSAARRNDHVVRFRDGRYLAVGNVQRSAHSLSTTGKIFKP